MIDKLVILTTCICRPELHSITISSFAKTLKEYSFDIVWLFNIDGKKKETSHDDSVIHTKSTQETTKMNILELLKENKNIKPHFYTPDTSGFYDAAKRLLVGIEKYVKKSDNVAILWLEDDWVLCKKLDLNYIFDELYSENCYISLNFNELTFPPFIISYNVLNRVIYKFKEKTDYVNPLKRNKVIDPEDCFKAFMLEMLRNYEIPICNILINTTNDLTDLFKLDEKWILNSIGLNKSRKVKAYYNKDNKSIVFSEKIDDIIKNKINILNNKVPFQTTTTSGYVTNCITEIEMISSKSDLDKIINDNKYFKIIKFGGWHHYFKMKNIDKLPKNDKKLWFYDGGRIWKKYIKEINKEKKLEKKIMITKKYLKL